MRTKEQCLSDLQDLVLSLRDKKDDLSNSDALRRRWSQKLSVFEVCCSQLSSIDLQWLESEFFNWCNREGIFSSVEKSIVDFKLRNASSNHK